MASERIWSQMIKITFGGGLEFLALSIEGVLKVAKAAADVFTVFFRKSRRFKVLGIVYFSLMFVSLTVTDKYYKLLKEIFHLLNLIICETIVTYT